MKRVLVLLLVMAMVFSQAVYAQEAAGVTMQEQTTPSVWAQWEVNMAKASGLGGQHVHSGYQSQVTQEGLNEMLNDLEEKFGLSMADIKDDDITRGDVIRMLNQVIGNSIESGLNVGEQKITSYFLANGLMAPNPSQEYGFDKPCSNEEMILFSRRVFEFISYEKDLDASGTYWKVSDDDNTVFLLGSVHVTDETVYPLSREMIKDFVGADHLVVEANILAPNPEDIAYVQQIMFLEGDTTIDQLISDEAYTRYVEILSTMGVPAETYNKLKPWYAAILLQNINMTSENISSAMGIDMYFLSLAYGRKPIIEMEGTKYQLDMFDSFSAELQEGYLMGVLGPDPDTIIEEATETKATDVEDEVTVKKMIEAWKIGDAQALEAMVFAETAVSDIEQEFNDKMWEVRNAHMVEEVKLMLTKSTDDFFVVVGAGHMLNDDGIVNSLEEAGYSVTQVK